METKWFDTNLLEGRDPKLWETLNRIFGSHDDPMPVVDRRAKKLLPGLTTILWEGDPETFQFSYVSPEAEEVLGYPCQLWLTDPSFWSGTVVYESDRQDAVAFCALATGKKEDHDFTYRARALDGRIVWLHDVVKVVLNERNLPVRLRGIMIDVTDRVDVPDRA